VVVSTELADGAAVARLTAARERVQTVNTDAVVEARTAQSLAVVDVDVTATPGVTDCADAPEAVALVHAATCARKHAHTRHPAIAA